MHMLTRRRLITAGASIAVFGGSIARSPGSAADKSSCEAETLPTTGMTNAPDYKWGAPERTSFVVAGIDGERLLLTGRILTTACHPVVGARLEFWHADATGKYDEAGFNFRGKQRTDQDGRFHLDTVVPGFYSGYRHIHFLVGAILPERPQTILLTDTIDFPTPEEFKNAPKMKGRSTLIPPSSISREGGVLVAPYDIVLEV